MNPTLGAASTSNAPKICGSCGGGHIALATRRQPVRRSVRITGAYLSTALQPEDPAPRGSSRMRRYTRCIYAFFMTVSTGLVLAGAAALGAYEAGVLRYLVEKVAPELGKKRLFDVVSGTSAGALNAMAFAAFADHPGNGVARTCAAWQAMRLGQVLKPSAIELLLSLIEATPVSARLPRAVLARRAHGGLLDPRPIMDVLATALPVERIEGHLARGLLHGVAISATHVATGHAAVFYQTHRPTLPWRTEPTAMVVPTRIQLAHAMASAAIPLLLPPVKIAADLYCDGGLRQMVPLSPSIHLGANRLLVINPLAPFGSIGQQQRTHAPVSSSPLYLGGKALNALFVDRTEVDLARLEQLSAVLRAGRRCFGAGFDAALNAELARAGAAPLREVTALRIGPSVDLSRLASEYIASSEFARRERGLVARMIRWVAEAGAEKTGDLLSYILFDGGFASALIAQGMADASRRHAELCAMFVDDRDEEDAWRSASSAGN
ncbi:MAG: patatin-like phospholipase family protein [Kofleriaceae bacterium]|nr:patatin-like phospholipase family protein [Kofleriaceae bacterium]